MRCSWAGIVELARGDLRLELGIEDDEIPAQPIDQPRALGNQDLPVIAQQPDLDGLLVEEGGREPLDALAQYSAGDRSRVDLVGLPRLSFAATRGTHQLRCDTQNTLTRGHERALEALRDVPAVLDCPHDLLAELTRPAQPLKMPLVGCSDLALGEHLPSVRVDGSEGVGALVGVHSDDDHPARPFNRGLV